MCQTALPGQLLTGKGSLSHLFPDLASILLPGTGLPEEFLRLLRSMLPAVY